MFLRDVQLTTARLTTYEKIVRQIQGQARP
jgi:hypothetical protein